VDRVDEIRAFSEAFVEAIMAGKTPNNQIWRYPTYWNFIRSESELIGSDGCSCVSGVNVDCCREHDLAYKLARDPRDAYKHFRIGRHVDSWEAALPIDRYTADKRFRQCHMNRSAFGKWSPMAWWRWAGVRLFGGRIWNCHRALETKASA
jgi:hypothetical protein